MRPKPEVARDVTDLKWATDGGVTARGHNDGQPASGVHEYILQVRAIQLGVHADHWAA